MWYRHLLCLLSVVSFSSFAQMATDLNLVPANVSGISVLQAERHDDGAFNLTVNLRVQMPNSCHYYVGKQRVNGEQEGSVKILAFIASRATGCSEMVQTIDVQTTLWLDPRRQPVVELTSSRFLFHEATESFIEIN